MQGWFKLIETIRKSNSPSTNSIRSSPNSSNSASHPITNKQQNSFDKALQPTNINGHSLPSLSLIATLNTLDSPPNIFNSPSIISISSTPQQIIEDFPIIEIESTYPSQLPRENLAGIEIDSPTNTATLSSPASAGL